MFLFIVIAFQSCAATMGEAFMQEEGGSGSTGLGVAFLVMIAGVIAACTRNSRSRVVTILPTLFYWLAGLIAVTSNGIYKDLPIWGALCLIFGLVFVIAGLKTHKERK